MYVRNVKLELESTECSSRGPTLDSQHSDGSSQLSGVFVGFVF